MEAVSCHMTIQGEKNLHVTFLVANKKFLTQTSVVLWCHVNSYMTCSDMKTNLRLSLPSNLSSSLSLFWFSHV